MSAVQAGIRSEPITMADMSLSEVLNSLAVATSSSTDLDHGIGYFNNDVSASQAKDIALSSLLYFSQELNMSQTSGESRYVCRICCIFRAYQWCVRSLVSRVKRYTQSSFKFFY